MSDFSQPSPGQNPRIPRPHQPAPPNAGPGFRAPPQFQQGPSGGYPPQGNNPPYSQPGAPANMPYGSSGEVWQGNYFVPPNNGKAVAAMVLGIVSILFSFFLGFGILPGLVAVPLGIAALSTAKRVRVGKGMAIAGICCGAVGVLLSGLILAAFVLAVNEIEGQIEARERPGHIHAADNEWVKVEGMQFHNVDDGLMTIGREVDTYLFEMDELPQSLMQVYEPLPTDPWERTFIIRIHRRNGTDKYVIMSQGADVASELDDIVYDGESGRIQIGPLRFGNTEKSQEFIQPKD